MKETEEPVILAADLPSAIQNGAWLEIECLQDATRKASTHAGLWMIRVCALAEGTIKKLVLVKATGLLVRQWRTAGGLMQFAMEHNAKCFVCPVRAGDKEVWLFETSKPPESVLTR